MANKEKLFTTAQKFLSKNQLGRAIKEYQKIVQAFPKEIQHQQKLAELLSREKRIEEALKAYEAVAKNYSDSGFYLKAIAVFKQMQRLEPKRADIYLKLAELNEKQGLVGNAMTEYRNLVAYYEENNLREEAIQTLEKMAKLDPGNLTVLAKIVECYQSDEQNDKAFEYFQ
ncbi:MAG: tetratricopeptide repeat protein, partial [Desulfuromonadales bacterium]|nr:tetratricopeptide repeat protein [Desulfuromonadales bacterium]